MSPRRRPRSRYRLRTLPCHHCGRAFRWSRRRAQPPRYCSKRCRRHAKRLRDLARLAYLRAHALCQRCKQPINGVLAT